MITGFSFTNAVRRDQTCHGPETLQRGATGRDKPPEHANHECFVIAFVDDAESCQTVPACARERTEG